MIPKWKIQEFITLLRKRYADWESFSHSGFMADETAGKRDTILRAKELLNQQTFDELLADGAFVTIHQRLGILAHDNNLLWRQVPGAGDTAVLAHPNLDLPQFCTQMRNLLYGDRPSPQRLASFIEYCRGQNLPHKWPFPTYFLFLCHPQREYFVKPRTARWFLKFMVTAAEGNKTSALEPNELLPLVPTAESYSRLQTAVLELRDALHPWGARDIVDVQSLIWVAESVSRIERGGLDKKGQVELDVPLSTPAAVIQKYQISPSIGLIQEKGAYQTPPETNGPLTLDACAESCGVDVEELSTWLHALHRKGQCIFYGPPGTGKTHIAQQLARYLAEQDSGMWQLLQFHPGYAYEDFVQGIRPLSNADGSLEYRLEPGHFLNFCRQSEKVTGTCVLILDEINRANLAAVFGELLVALEYRQTAVSLAAGGTLLVPHNVRLIGTMNSADRSIALVDHALRRRFAFVSLTPNYALLRKAYAEQEFKVEPLIQLLQTINEQIGDPQLAIGYTFFLTADLHQHLAAIWKLEIEPYLEEIWFDQPPVVDQYRWARVKSELGFA
jgi:hypothetical protein